MANQSNPFETRHIYYIFEIIMPYFTALDKNSHFIKVEKHEQKQDEAKLSFIVWLMSNDKMNECFDVYIRNGYGEKKSYKVRL